MANTKYSKVKISGISIVIPDNKQYDKINDISFYTSPSGVTNVDMCQAALLDLMENMKISKDEIDVLLFVHQYPDHLSPSSSHIIHKRFNLSTNTFVFDIYHGGSGYLYGLWVASSMIETGQYKKIIVLAGEHINDFNTNKSLNLHLSSGGSATLLELSESEIDSCYLFGVDSYKYSDIIIPAGLYRLPINEEILDAKYNDNQGNQWTLMQKIYNKESFLEFIRTNIPYAVKNILNNNSYIIDDIDFFAINQFNQNIVEELAKELHLNSGKFSSNTYKLYGNQVIISSLCNLVDTFYNNLINNNNKICFINYGEGLSYSIAIITIEKIYCSNIIIKKIDNLLTSEEYKDFWKSHMKTGSSY